MRSGMRSEQTFIALGQRVWNTQPEGGFAGLAIGSFGPIDIDKNSKTYGFITTTPKPNWANVDLLGALRRE